MIYIYLSCKTPNITTKPYCNPSCMDTPVCTHLGGAKVSEQPQLRSHRQQSRLRPQLARVHVPLGPSDRRQKDRVRGLRWTRGGGGGGSEAQQRVCDQVSKHKRSNRCTTIRSPQVAKTQPNPTYLDTVQHNNQLDTTATNKIKKRRDTTQHNN